jgi:uncharacterized FlgJ-related protein
MKLYYIDKRNLMYKSLNIRQYSLILIGLFLLFSSVGFTTGVKLNKIIDKVPIIIRMEEIKFSEDNLRQEIRKLNLKFEDVLIKQYKLETGNGTSQVFLQNHNLFGFKNAYFRPSTAIGNNLGHALYEDWNQSVLDMAMFQAQVLRNINTEEEYYQFLDQFYSETKDYSTRLKAIK